MERIAFAEKMAEEALTFPSESIDEIATLVVKVACARGGWRVIKDATEERRR